MKQNKIKGFVLMGMIACLLTGITGCGVRLKTPPRNIPVSGSADLEGSGVPEDTKKPVKKDSKPEKTEPKLPASQQESEQYKQLKEASEEYPSYAYDYPGMYADTVQTQKVLSDKKVCYLTFDDGPSSTNTPGILDVLKRENVKATFFVVANTINPETEPILKRIIDEGHTLCIHCNSHQYSSLYASTEAYLADFAEAYDKIYELTGYRVQGFRFPGGSNGQVNKSGCYDAIVQEMHRRGFEYYDWNAYDHDAENGNYTVEEMIAFAVEETRVSSRNDVIMLLHDTYGKEKTVQALPGIISRLQDAGIELLPITDSTRPVHFQVNENTPPEYIEPEPAEEEIEEESHEDLAEEA